MIAELVVALACAGAVFTAAFALRRASPRRWPADLGRWLLAHPAAAPLRARLERALELAGDDPRAIDVAAGAPVLLGLAGFAIAAIGWASGASPIVLFAPLIALLPIVRLRDRVRRRQAAIGRALPWSLDLLGLAVEVGVDFNVGLARVVEHSRPGPWPEELARTLRSLRLGATREEALEALRRRSGHPAVARFCAAVIQADRLGTPLRRVLDAQAADLRIERSQRAEKLAGEAPVKLLLPLVLCIFPTVFLVLFGPIAFSILHGGGVP